MLLPSGNPFKCHEEVLFLQPMIPPKRFDIFSPLTKGCSDGLDAFIFFFQNHRICLELGRSQTNFVREPGDAY